MNISHDISASVIASGTSPAEWFAIYKTNLLIPVC